MYMQFLQKNIYQLGGVYENFKNIHQPNRVYMFKKFNLCIGKRPSFSLLQDKSKSTYLLFFQSSSLCYYLHIFTWIEDKGTTNQSIIMSITYTTNSNMFHRMIYNFHVQKQPNKNKIPYMKILTNLILNKIDIYIQVVFKFTPFLVKFTPFTRSILCRLRVCSFISSITSAGKLSNCALIDHRPHTCVARTVYRGMGQTHSNLICI